MICPLETRGDAELLIAYISSGLPADQKLTLELHLSECSSCRKFVQQQQVVWQALDSWEPQPVSMDFNRQLYRRIEQQPVSWWQRVCQPFRSLPLRQIVPVAATVVLVVAAGILLDQPSRPPSAPPRTTTAQTEALKPEQVVEALDEMEVLSQFNHLIKPEDANPRM